MQLIGGLALDISEGVEPDPRGMTDGVPGQGVDLRGLRDGVHLDSGRAAFFRRQEFQERAQAMQIVQG
jgi:hypothetical protein